MNAWVVTHPAPIDADPLEFVAVEIPEPGSKQVRVKVSTCGVCRTDLHVAEGDLPPRRERVVPGHEIVGTIEALGDGASRFARGQRIGIPWLGLTCRSCRFCSTRRENLCTAPRFTGWDEHGGYAEFAVVHEDYAYELPETFDDDHAAPLLCAGIIGYRALRRSGVPPGGTLGIYGFGGSAHIAAQVALFEGTEVHVMTRGEKARALALELGVASVQPADGEPPRPLDAAILFAPAGELIPGALAALDRGARLAIAGIHVDHVPSLDYTRHLFQERELVSVTANTRRDGEEFLEVAASIPIRVTTTAFGLDEAQTALKALAHGEIVGAAVLHAP